MKKIKYIIFDFDGTLVNTLNTGVCLYNQIALEVGTKQVAENQIEELRHKKTKELMKEFDITFFKLPKLILRLKKDLNKNIANIKIFPDIYKVICTLKDKGYELGIMTSNSTENVRQFFNKNNLLEKFSFIKSGKNIFGKNKSLERLLKDKKINKEEVVYVGDEVRDIEACKKVGLKIISVSWGFNSKKALSEEGPDFIIDSPKELLKILN